MENSLPVTSQSACAVAVPDITVIAADMKIIGEILK
jgi:hypothetical protein